jgi:hypothetical protein
MKSRLVTVPKEDRPAIQPRLFALPQAKNMPRYWMDDNAATTHFMNSLSCIFPGGERFFVRSVLEHLSEIGDERLKMEARQFCGQEAIHGQQHEALNQWGSSQGWDLEGRAKFDEDQVIRVLGRLPKRRRLAATVALEHLTAVIGNAFLSCPEVLEAVHPEVRTLWVWHAIEEIEHKAVAHEVFYAVGGKDSERYQALISCSIGLAMGVTRHTLGLMKRDGKLWDLRSYRRLFRLIKKSGFAGRVWQGYKDFFRHDFHPWQTDDRSLLTRFLPDLNKYLPSRRELKEVV